MNFKETGFDNCNNSSLFNDLMNNLTNIYIFITSSKFNPKLHLQTLGKRSKLQIKHSFTDVSFTLVATTDLLVGSLSKHVVQTHFLFEILKIFLMRI